MTLKWQYVEETGRYYARKKVGNRYKFLIAGADAQKPPTYWFSVFSQGEEIASGDRLESLQRAQELAEAV